MIILNESCKVDAAVAAEFIDFVQTEYIPQMVDTGCFTNGRLSRLFDPVFAEEEGLTMVIQFFADSEAAYQLYKEEHKQRLGSVILLAFDEQVSTFQTAMKIVT